MATDLTTAKEITAQLGKQTLFMLGAYNLVGDNNSLSLKFKGSTKVNYLKITLTPMDVYEMEFGYIRDYTYTVVVIKHNVYNDMLHDVIEEVTHLATTMPNIIFKT